LSSWHRDISVGGASCYLQETLDTPSELGDAARANLLKRSFYSKWTPKQSRMNLHDEQGAFGVA
jgi:hypothetical protein